MATSRSSSLHHGVWQSRVSITFATGGRSARRKREVAGDSAVSIRRLSVCEGQHLDDAGDLKHALNGARATQQRQTVRVR
jgi:hypothetical protein